MNKKEFQGKVAETAFWVVISPLVSMVMVVISFVLGIIEGGKWFIEQAVDYYKNIERIWTN